MVGTAIGGMMFAYLRKDVQTNIETKIVIDLSGRGNVRDVYAESEDGNRITPASVVDHDSGYGEWGLFFHFPSPGCWRVHAARDDSMGDLWFVVVNEH